MPKPATPLSGVCGQDPELAVAVAFAAGIEGLVGKPM